MGKRVLLLVLLLLGTLTAWGKEPDPHRQAARCLQHWRADCDRICSFCHQTIGVPASSPAGLDDLYSDLEAASVTKENWGDLPLCLTCHPEHGGGSDSVAVSTLSMASVETDTGSSSSNHPVDVLYPLNDPEYIREPQGVTLYCNEEKTECWVYCTTCHDMHGPDGPLPQREICLDCHIK